MDEIFKEWLKAIPREEHLLCPATSWEPAADIYQTGDGWLIKFDLAGVRPADISVRVAGRKLTVTGIRRDLRQEAGTRYYRMEISYNSFQRTIDLPREVDTSRLASDFRDGMLFVQLYDRTS